MHECIGYMCCVTENFSHGEVDLKSTFKEKDFKVFALFSLPNQRRLRLAEYWVSGCVTKKEGREKTIQYSAK